MLFFLYVWEASSCVDKHYCPKLMDNSVFGQIQLAEACVSEYLVDTAVAIYFCHLFSV